MKLIEDKLPKRPREPLFKGFGEWWYHVDLFSVVFVCFIAFLMIGIPFIISFNTSEHDEIGWQSYDDIKEWKTELSSPTFDEQLRKFYIDDQISRQEYKALERMQRKEKILK